MNQFWKEVRLAALMGLVLPAVVLRAAVALEKEPVEIPVVTEPAATEMAQDPVMISVLHQGEPVQMELSDYLTGVILAEMPASFEAEALKAQAVVARTYTVRAMTRGSKHEEGAVCTNSACCQGYISEQDYIAKGGTEEKIEKMRSAVEDTADLVLTYEGNLIEATYFSCSGGSTEDAVAVWGTNVPYLQAVESPGEEQATHYTDSVTFTAQEFAEALSMELTGDPATWFGKASYTAGGGVDTIEIGGIGFSGTALRSTLGLRSTAFSIATEGNRIIITTKGYGHRVGMSQYGADAMAASGSDFTQILAHYYQGTVLEQWVH